jgi:Protein of unknown function (DUF2591)
MRVKVSEASGVVLDYLVAVARGFDVYHNATLNGCVIEGFWVSGYYPGDLNSWVPLNVLTHSTSWHLGGPIIEREFITIGPYHGDNGEPTGVFQGYIGWDENSLDPLFQCDGPTPLIAAMRCFCLAKLGEEVEVPEELCE